MSAQMLPSTVPAMQIAMPQVTSMPMQMVQAPGAGTMYVTSSGVSTTAYGCAAPSTYTYGAPQACGAQQLYMTSSPVMPGYMVPSTMASASPSTVFQPASATMQAMAAPSTTTPVLPTAPSMVAMPGYTMAPQATAGGTTMYVPSIGGPEMATNQTLATETVQGAVAEPAPMVTSMATMASPSKTQKGKKKVGSKKKSKANCC
mmetsp:Transcript_29175/g.57123  ORF Transcript_29175/g.57123 Transcript_29175/m.57123 type:complete len:203 (+) Transcript_29175:91-699(+)